MSSIDRWSINESLLQSYRSTFISTQSFLLAVGAILADQSKPLVFLTSAMGILIIWAVWFPVVRARHRIVDYHKYSSALAPEELHDRCSESEYVHNKNLRALANVKFALPTNWRSTRIKLDAGLPVIFTVMWLALIIQECFEA